MNRNPPIGIACLVVLVGPPGSGKTTWAQRNGRGAIHVSQDGLIDAISPGSFVTISHAACDLTGVAISYQNRGGATVPRGGGTSIGNSDGFELAVHSGSLDVTITVSGPHGNALWKGRRRAAFPRASAVRSLLKPTSPEISGNEPLDARIAQSPPITV